MNVFKYLYYRVYNKLNNNNVHSAKLGAFIYINSVFFTLIGLIYVALEKILFIPFLFEAMIYINTVLLFLFSFLLISVFNYFYFLNKGLVYYCNLFDSKVQANTKMKTWMVFIIPFVFMSMIILFESFIN